MRVGKPALSVSRTQLSTVKLLLGLLNCTSNCPVFAVLFPQSTLQEYWALVPPMYALAPA